MGAKAPTSQEKWMSNVEHIHCVEILSLNVFRAEMFAGFVCSRNVINIHDYCCCWRKLMDVTCIILIVMEANYDEAVINH